MTIQPSIYAEILPFQTPRFLSPSSPGPPNRILNSKERFFIRAMLSYQFFRLQSCKSGWKIIIIIIKMNCVHSFSNAPNVQAGFVASAAHTHENRTWEAILAFLASCNVLRALLSLYSGSHFLFFFSPLSIFYSHYIIFRQLPYSVFCLRRYAFSPPLSRGRGDWFQALVAANREWEFIGRGLDRRWTYRMRPCTLEESTRCMQSCKNQHSHRHISHLQWKTLRTIGFNYCADPAAQLQSAFCSGSSCTHPSCVHPFAFLLHHRLPCVNQRSSELKFSTRCSFLPPAFNASETAPQLRCAALRFH